MRRVRLYHFYSKKFFNKIFNELFKFKIGKFFFPKIKYLKNSIKYIKTFSPHEKVIIVWDFFFMVILLYLIIITPFQFFFHLPEEDFNLYILYLYKFSKIFYILDIIINLNCGYYLRGIIIKDRKKILINYFKNSFLNDILGLIPLLIDSSNIFQFLFAFQIIKFKNLIKKLDEVLLLKDNWKGNVLILFLINCLKIFENVNNLFFKLYIFIYFKH